MTDAHRTYTLANGLVVNLFDRTARYFGGYFTVVLELEAAVPVSPDLLPPDVPDDEARSLLGPTRIYRRSLTRKGVYEDDIAGARSELVAEFERNSMPYLEKPAFLRKFIASELRNELKKRPRSR